MNRHIAVGARALSKTHQTSPPLQLSRSLSSRNSTHSQSASGNVSSITEWLASFNNNPEMIPSRIVKVEYDRSHARSPPKFICRAPIDALKEYVPKEILEKVQNSHHKRSSEAVITTLNEKTSPDNNRRLCIKKLRALFQEVAKDIIAESSTKPPQQAEEKAEDD